jgi:hypothetical protein
MKKTIMYALFTIALASCGDVTTKLEEKQRMLDGKLNQLDSALNAEMNRVMELDTLITKEKAMLDSILNTEHKILGK